MIFNFYLGNHHAYTLNSLADLVMPIVAGLEENGHHVIAFGTDMRQAPVINVLMEFFQDNPFAERILSAKRENGDRFRYGVLCTEDIEDRLVMDPERNPRRYANLVRILPEADFVWTLLPQNDVYEKICGPDRVALLEYGFTESFLARNVLLDPRLRDVDAVLYGNENDHRRPIAEALRKRGLECFISSREGWPNYIMNDIIRRSKVLLDLRRGPGVRFLSPTRINRGLHSRVAVVSERFDVSPISSLYGYTTTADYDQLAETCAEIIRSGRHVALGLDAAARYQAETSMQRNVARALSLPAFERLARDA